MLPLYKLYSLLLRVFSRPLINLTKRYHATNEIKSDRIRRFFHRLGNWFHAFETRINRRYLKTDASKINVKPLAEPAAVEKGIQFFYEIIFYTIAIGFPTYELYRAAKDSQVKDKRVTDRVKSIEGGIKMLGSGVEAIGELNGDESGDLKYLAMELVTKYMSFTHMYGKQPQIRVNLLV